MVTRFQRDHRDAAGGQSAGSAQRHHLVLLAFRAWSRSLPWFPIATRALVEVSTLVEMLADDRARQEVSDDDLAQSIALVASASGGATVGARAPNLLRTAPDAAANALAADGDSAHRRIARLVDSPRPLAIQARLFAVGCSVALLAVPTALLVYHAFL